MEGWTEDEIKNKDLMSPCGLYCCACGVYIATRDKNEKFREIMGNLYGTKPEETACLGCMQPEPPKEIYGYCRMCSIRSCVKSKGFYSCHQCADWPCDMIENFGFATGKTDDEEFYPRLARKGFSARRRERQCGMGALGV